ncbi:MAG: hypothetical protein QOF35_925 [Actinomycetota bacterium]|nr:hypothetical protein [Actinomycetota bacterium]
MSTGRRVAAIALCLGLAAGVAATVGGQLDLPGVVARLGQSTERLLGRDGTNQAASPIPKVDAAARLQAAQSLLSARAAAVGAKDKGSWMATVDGNSKPGAAGTAFRERQSQVFDNLIKLPLDQFSYGPVRTAPALTATRLRQVGPAAWAAASTGTYRLVGFSRAPQTFEATYTFVHRPGGWRIADDADGGMASLQMWDLPGLKVVRGRSGIVIGNAPEARMQAYSTIADSAVRRVSAVWGAGWNSHVVLVTPATDEEFARLLSRSGDKGLDQVAAITQGAVESGRRAQGDRVVINPRAFTALQPTGRRVVVTHELTHVAVRSSTTGAVPIWLTEGMAEYVGYSGVELPRNRVASELLAQVRAGKGPTALPTDSDFEPSLTQIAPSYSGSWLAVSQLVDRYGQAKVVRFYRLVASGTTADRVVQPDPQAAAASAFPPSFGITQAQFVDGWKRYLATLAKAPG